MGNALTVARARLTHVTDRVSGRHRMTPGYLVVGTKRGGSTSLADWIEEHPLVGPCRVGKGTHYFDIHHHRGRAWYDAQFPTTGEGYALTGESSPYYMFHPLAAQRVVAELPQVKVVACLRDPVERAWSHHAYEVARGHETESFERALELEPERLAGEAERLAADPSYDAPHWRYHAYLRRGHYAEQLAPYLQGLGPQQVLVVQSEALFADPAAQLARVFDFLGLPAHDGGDHRALNAGRDRSPVPEAVRERLRAYYAPHDAALYALPGVDFRWPHPGPAAAPTTAVQARTGAA
ncbi:hypothetical protein GCM10009814_10590 [Lapillicoccus jejuensis]|uniref:Sulfotransferase domain-containing protein n=2 Tax=Lapillicoccus jejuensis TaxID=402171 RepID=A0A542E1H1_9MICO|nr:sulfotransferase domain-containing protein [Lapillicoccus jejuensis]